MAVFVPRVASPWNNRSNNRKSAVLYSVLCFNKRTVIFISYKRIEIKVFLLLPRREISSRLECVHENLLMFFFVFITVFVLFSFLKKDVKMFRQQLETWKSFIRKRRESFECEWRRYKRSRLTTIQHTIATTLSSVVKSLWFLLHISFTNEASAYKETEKYTTTSLVRSFERGQ